LGQAELALQPPGSERRARLNAALDRLASKFGSGAVVTADLAEADAGEGGPDDDVRRLGGASRLDKRGPASEN
jgi:hypothetical protein